MLKWPWCNGVQITGNTTSAYYEQHVVLYAMWHEVTAQLLNLTEFKSHLLEHYHIGWTINKPSAMQAGGQTNKHMCLHRSKYYLHRSTSCLFFQRQDSTLEVTILADIKFRMKTWVSDTHIKSCLIYKSDNTPTSNTETAKSRMSGRKMVVLMSWWSWMPQNLVCSTERPV